MLGVGEEQLLAIVRSEIRRGLEHCRGVDCGGVEKVIIYIRRCRRCRLAAGAIVRVGGSAV